MSFKPQLIRCAHTLPFLPQLTLVEVTLFTALFIMSLVILGEQLTIHDAGSYEKVKMAKMQVQEELMAYRTHPGN